MRVQINETENVLLPFSHLRVSHYRVTASFLFNG